MTEAPATLPIPETSDTPTTIPIDIVMFQSLEKRASELSQHLSETVQQLGMHMNKVLYSQIYILLETENTHQYILTFIYW
ncbi:unnamed protein product [Absidia cylindrospora]